MHQIVLYRFFEDVGWLWMCDKDLCTISSHHIHAAYTMFAQMDSNVKRYKGGHRKFSCAINGTLTETQVMDPKHPIPRFPLNFLIWFFILFLSNRLMWVQKIGRAQWAAPGSIRDCGCGDLHVHGWGTCKGVPGVWVRSKVSSLPFPPLHGSACFLQWTGFICGLLFARLPNRTGEKPWSTFFCKVESLSHSPPS